MRSPLVLAAAVLAPALGAQPPAGTLARPACARALAPAAFGSYALALVAHPTAGGVVIATPGDGPARRALVVALNAVGTHLRLPDSLGIPTGAGGVYVPVARARGRLARPEVRARIDFVVRGSGEVTGALLTPSALPAVDSALVRALREAIEARELAPALARGAVPGDMLPVALELGEGDDTTGVAARLATLRLPHYAATPAERVQGGGATVYPVAAPESRVEGDVVARFVVDADGRAEPATVLVVRGDALLEGEVRRVLPTLRFRPATARGCPVRMAVQQSFRFRLATSR